MDTQTSGYLQVKDSFEKAKQQNPLDTLQTGQLNQYIPQQTCPNCGYCPHCGRGGYQTYPYPWYSQPYTPYWQTDVWCGGTTTQSTSTGTGK